MKKILHLLFAVTVLCSLNGQMHAQSCYAYFYYTNISGTTQVQFHDTSYFTGTATYSWSFGDGNYSTQQSPVHGYSGAGPYYACLTISTSNGCQSTYCDSVYIVNATCHANFSYSLISGTNNFQFTNLSSSAGTPSYYWSFGDGTTSTQTNPSHLYSLTGWFTVCLYLTDSLQSCTDSYCAQVYVSGGASCQAYFTYWTDSTTHTTYFTDQSSGTPTTWVWVFDNTFTATGQNPSYQFPTTGWHWACLTISDSVSGCYSNYCDSIYISNGGGATCGASYSYSVSGNVVTFAGMPTGTYSGYIWDFGDGSTSTTLNPVHTYANGGSYLACLNVYFNGAICSQYCLPITVSGGAATDTICGIVFNDLNGNGVQDAGEPGIQNAYISGFSSNGNWFTILTDTLGQYTYILSPGTYTMYYCPPNGYTFTVPLGLDTAGCAMYIFTLTAGQNVCGLNFGIQNTSVTIEGTLFLDANNNGVMDAGEGGIPYQYILVGSYYAYTNASGNYSVIVPAGTYTVSYTPSGPYTGYTVTTPSSYSVAATTIGNTYGNNNFGLYIVPGTVNLSVTITPHTTVTPGFPAWYDIEVCNIGANATAATLTMNYDAGLTYNYASPAESSHNATTHVLTWNLPVITPGSCSDIWVDFDALASLNIGDNTVENVFVTPTTGTDIDMTNNFDSVHQIVTGSWDPNNKLSVKTNTINPNEQTISSSNADQWITYTINFQNTGTGPAVNIIVIDQLSADLNASTFTLTGTSHNCTVTRNGGMLNFNFSSIWLPDVTTNPGASHGFITFKVKANNGLAIGHTISDNADIYFDYNSPVTTNFANVIMVGPTAVQNPVVSASQLSIYPNPVSTVATVSYSLKQDAQVAVYVYDMAGKQVMQLVNEKQSAGNYNTILSSNELSKGMYLVKLFINQNEYIQKLSVAK